jgi:hypothetical protein
MKDILGLVAFPNLSFFRQHISRFLVFCFVGILDLHTEASDSAMVSVLAGSLLIISTTLRVASPLGLVLGPAHTPP